MIATNVLLLFVNTWFKKRPTDVVGSSILRPQSVNKLQCCIDASCSVMCVSVCIFPTNGEREHSSDHAVL